MNRSINNTLAVARREASALFYSPIAYVVMALFVFLASLFFLLTTFQSGRPAQLQRTFFWTVWVLIAIAPAISMRLLSEELRSGTLEALMTAPLTDFQVIVGKWLGAMGFFLVMLVPTLVLVGVLAIWSDPDPGPIFSGYLGLILVGALYVAIGTFASVLTQNQIIAFLLTVFIILMFTVVTYFLPDTLPSGWSNAVTYLNFNEQYRKFSMGLVHTGNFVYFLAGTGLFLALGVKALESRRWA